MWSPAAPLAVSVEDREQLSRLVRSPRTPQKLVVRARIVLLASEGLANVVIAKKAGANRNTVLLWRHGQAASGAWRPTWCGAL